MPKSPKSTDGALLSPSASQDVPGPMPATERAAEAVPPGQKPPARAEAPDQHHDEPRHPGIPLAPPGIVPESDVRVHSPSSAAPQASHGQINEGLGELPWGYGDGRLVALVRDPATLFVYWDFSQQQIEQAFAGLGASRAVLKILDSRAELVRATEVRIDARGWYLRDLPPGVELRVELWALGEKGARMLRSARPVKMPAAAPSDLTEAFYMRLPLDQSLRDGLQTGRPLSYGGSAPPGWERRVQARPFTGSSYGGPYGSSPGRRDKPE